MAKLVIKSSQLSVKQSNTPNIQALSISPNIYSKLGSDISQSGKVFEKIKADQRAIQDQNRSWEIISTKQKDIDKAIVSGSKLSDYDAAEKILNTAYEIDLSKESKGVQKLVND